MLRKISEAIRLSLLYFKYRIEALDAHGIHSPFVFEFYNKVLHDSTNFTDYKAVEKLRKQYLNNTNSIDITDFGAGTFGTKLYKRQVNHIAKTSAKSPKYGQLLYRISRHFQPKTTIELGTSLGITTAYLAKAAAPNTVVSFEGCPTIAGLAQAGFEQIGLKNIQLITGNMDETLAPTVTQLPALDLVFFDGNHRLEPTLRYFETCLSKAHEHSVFIFDDIYWSAEMRRAWKEIKARPEVMLTIDLFFIGLVFFRQNQPKQHFVLRF